MEITRKIEQLRTRCKSEGVPLTQQRIEIYKFLLSSKEHPSPELIYNRLKNEFPTLSLATVYNNLEALNRLGVIQKINPLSDHARYDGDLTSHVHFVCVICKGVEDIEYRGFDERLIPDLPDSERKILGKSIQYIGVCQKCQNNTMEE